MTFTVSTKGISFLQVWFGVGFFANDWDPGYTF